MRTGQILEIIEATNQVGNRFLTMAKIELKITTIILGTLGTNICYHNIDRYMTAFPKMRSINQNSA